MSKEPDSTTKDALRKSMDGPTIPWTVADLSYKPAKFGMIYHVMISGYAAATPAGCLLGGIFSPLFASTPALQIMATGGLLAGTAGMTVGLLGLRFVASRGDAASPPWNEEGIQQRIDGISHNFKIRALDLGMWTGIGVASGVLLMMRGPVRLGLRRGVVGTLQALSLGSAAGSVSAVAYTFNTLDRTMVTYDDDDDEKAANE